MLVHPELGRRHAGLDDAVDRHVPAVDGQAAERALQLVERQARRRAAPRGSCRPPRRRNSRSRESSPSGLFLEAEVLPVAENDVVDQLDPDHLARPRPAAASAAGPSRSASGRRTGGCETPPRSPPTPAIATRNTSRGCTTVASSVPVDTIARPNQPVLLIEQHHAAPLDAETRQTAASGSRPRPRASGSAADPGVVPRQACAAPVPPPPAPAPRATRQCPAPAPVRPAQAGPGPAGRRRPSITSCATVSAPRARVPAPITSASNSLSPSASTPDPRQLLARPVVDGHVGHRARTLHGS